MLTLTSAMSAHSYCYPDTLSDDGDSDTDSDRYTEMSLDSSVATSRTSADLSMRSVSPTPSVLSVTSSLRAQAYRQEHGRGFNNYSDVYPLPADNEELERLGSFITTSLLFLPSPMSETNSMKSFAKWWEDIRPLFPK